MRHGRAQTSRVQGHSLRISGFCWGEQKGACQETQNTKKIMGSILKIISNIKKTNKTKKNRNNDAKKL